MKTSSLAKPPVDRSGVPAERRKLKEMKEGGFLPKAATRILQGSISQTSAALCFWLVAGIASAQPVPHLAYAYPAGGRAGTTFQVVVGGQNLIAVSNAFVSGDGIQTRVLGCTRPMGQKEFNALRDRFKALQDKFLASRKGATGTNVWTAADEQEMEAVRIKMIANPPNRSANPAMLDTVYVTVSIATNTVPGIHEIRLASPNALSNPLRFCVGTLPEVAKTAAKPANPDLARFLERLGHPTPPGTPKYEARVSLPVTVNGQIMPGEVDRYRFSARRGQQLVIAADARTLIPYLADAVPGWFEATLTLYDAKGKELARNERFRFKPDPVIHFEVPDNGDYILEIHDSIFRGREDFVYRLTLGELPFVTGIFPLGGRAGETTTVALAGWNLPQSSVTVDNAGASPGLTSLTGDFYKAMPFAVDDLPEMFESESNHSTADAQPVTLPVIVNGRISRPGEIDVFRFDGRAGQAIVAEVVARRLDSPLDSFLRLTDAAGKQLAFNDDFEDKGSGLETHHADSYLAATLPADGTYFIHLGDTQGQGGPEFAYRLRLSEPRPDFALRLVPSSLTVRAGLSVPATVYVLRRDGFTNSVDLHLRNAPAGFSLSGARIAANQDRAQFTVKAPPPAAGKKITLAVDGSTVIAGQSVTRPAVPAEDLMQAFAYRHLVPSCECDLIVVPGPRPFAADAIKILSATPVKIPAGGTARVRVATPSPAFANRFNLELRDGPDGLSLKNISPADPGIELEIAADPAKIKPGATGNLIIDVLPKNAGTNANPKRPVNRPAVATLPAIPFTIEKN